LSLSNSGEIEVVKHFGRICIHEGFENVFATILFPQPIPNHAKAHAINPNALVAIGRPKLILICPLCEEPLSTSSWLALWPID
jgi:hypothetical protein